MPDTHTCHVPGCTKPLPAQLVTCRAAWYSIPKPLRDAIWRSYRPGQEADKHPSPEYIAAQRAAMAAVRRCA